MKLCQRLVPGLIFLFPSFLLAEDFDWRAQACITETIDEYTQAHPDADYRPNSNAENFRILILDLRRLIYRDCGVNVDDYHVTVPLLELRDPAGRFHYATAGKDATQVMRTLRARPVRTIGRVWFTIARNDPNYVSLLRCPVPVARKWRYEMRIKTCGGGPEQPLGHLLKKQGQSTRRQDLYVSVRNSEPNHSRLNDRPLPGFRRASSLGYAWHHNE